MKFFVLDNPKAGEGAAVTDFVPVDGSRTGEAPRCTVCRVYIGMRPLLPPIHVELDTWGSEFGDIAFGPGNELLISERCVKIFRASNLSGLIDVGPVEIKKVKLHKKLRGLAPQYYCYRVGHSRAVIDEAMSGLISEEPWTCIECRISGIIKRARSIVLAPNSWSGEDIFFARGLPGTVLASEKFQRLSQENQISNCLLVPAEEFSFDHYPWENLNARDIWH